MRSEQIEENRQWYEERGIDVNVLIKKEKELEVNLITPKETK